MRERDEAPYWNETEDLGLFYYGRAHRPLRARSHHETEPVRRSGHPNLFGVGLGTFRCDYLQTRLLMPDNGLHRDLRLADGQSWHYPADRTIVVWELTPEPQLAVDDPRESLLYRTLWTRYEQYLARRFPDADTLLTTWEDTYARCDWKGFLRAIGYAHTAPAIFKKKWAR